MTHPDSPVSHTAPIVAALVVSGSLMALCRSLVAGLAADMDLTGADAGATAARYVMNDFCLAIAMLGCAGLVYAGLLLWGGGWERRVLTGAHPGPVPAVVAYLTGCIRDPGAVMRAVQMSSADPMMRAADAADLWETLRTRRAIPLGLVIWALPLLGFIGTVIGISHAIGGLGEVFAASAREAALSDVLGSLRFAFDTTFVGLASVLPTMVAMQVLRGTADASRRLLVRRVTLDEPAG